MNLNMKQFLGDGEGKTMIQVQKGVVLIMNVINLQTQTLQSAKTSMLS